MARDTDTHRDDDVDTTTGESDARPDAAGGPARVEYRGAGIIAGVIAGVLLAVAVIIVLVQNTDSVPFDFLWFEVDVPLGVLLLIAGLIALVAGEVIGVLWRRRRRQVRSMRSELDTLRQRG